MEGVERADERGAHDRRKGMNRESAATSWLIADRSKSTQRGRGAPDLDQPFRRFPGADVWDWDATVDGPESGPKEWSATVGPAGDR